MKLRGKQVCFRNLIKMKQKLILLIFLIFSGSVFATVQTPDLLIIGKDTVFLQEFPLEQLKMKDKPFAEEEKHSINTGCMRGYQAIWKIVDEKLYLEKIVHCGRITVRDEYEEIYKDRFLNEDEITELFKRNKIEYQEKDGMILSDWVTVDLYKYHLLLNNKAFLFLNKRKDNKKDEITLQIKKGIVTINKVNQF
jgi:hypothetical protein